MQAFLEKVAAHIASNYPDRLDKICVVFPNRRARLFLNRYMAEHFDRPVWAVRSFSIEDLVTELTGLNIPDNITLQFELYKVHQQIAGREAEPFDSFIKWGQVLISDFNETDLHMADAEKVFTFLSEAKAIQLWDPERKKLTEFQQNYLKFYRSLKEYYQLFTKHLLGQHLAYQGLAYRKLATGYQDGSIPWEKIIFAGFNALSGSEAMWMSQLVKDGKAEIFWDTDSYYADDKVQEAGRFIRKNRKEHFANTGFNWKEDFFKTGEKKINVLGVPQRVGQAKLAGQLLEEISRKHGTTAVVLNDEELLFPLLNSLPENLTGFNVTMGMPLRATPAAGLFSSLLEMQVNALSFAQKRNSDKPLYYTRDILTILNHPYIKKVFRHCQPEGADMQALLTDVRQSNKIFFGGEELFRHLRIRDNDQHATIFESWNNQIEKALENLQQTTDLLATVFISETNNNRDLELEYLYHFRAIVKRIKSLIGEPVIIENIRVLKDIFQQFMNQSSIPFYGEPLKGVQIMGVLETRTLDFDNVIMLSVNEDYLPPARFRNSFIPFDVRANFKLPTHHDRDAIAAYHFYRLLQRASNVWLIYNT